MARVIIDDYGTKRYFNDEGNPYRSDGPFVITNSGTFWFYISKEEKYSFSNEGILRFFKHFELYRIGKPAVALPNGLKEWWDERGRVWPKL